MPPSNPWPDCQTWFHNTTKLFDFIKHSVHGSNPNIHSLLVAQLADHLKGRLNFKHVAADEEAYKLYCACVKFINTQIFTGAKAPFVLDSLKAFTHEMHAFCSHESIKPQRYLDSSDEEEVQIVNITNDNLEMQDARSLSTSVHTPKSGSTNEPAQKVCFSKNNAVDKKEKDKKVLSKSLDVTTTAPETKSTTSASKKNINIISKLDEQALHALTFESIAKKSALIPFLDLEKASSEVLLSVTNFLHAELSSLEHNIHFYIGQYQVSSKSLEEVNCICLFKVAIQDEQIGEAQPICATIEVGTVSALVDT
ncbi:hypothetical protein Moror_12049 [Moniliophthora roreri MCA 2997]|uniref:Uncharacterized protein n=1 Tax=Moniliophthora roreri (strain MCA 2997) TaxID=1381753 RepID=V2WTW3_MONRO|nr:hypothetical protein Moror_12049 [Moniliophthora roreri MCA 2997]